jgi:signal transduction histidine kinase
VLLGWSVLRATEEQRSLAEELVQRVARNIASDADAFLRVQQDVAGNLARRDSVRRLDPAACDPLLDQLAAVHGSIDEIFTVDLAGRVICGHPAFAGLPGDGTPEWAAHLGAQRATVGPPVRTPPDGPWTMAVTHAILDRAGHLAGALVVTAPVPALFRVVGNPLPAGGATALVDGDGRIVARSPDPLLHVGGSAVAAVDLWRTRGSRSTLVTQGVDGTERVFAMRPVGATGWYAAAGVPVESIYGPVRRSLVGYGLAGLGVLLGCGALVLALGRRVVRPLRALAQTAHDVAQGRWDRRAPEDGPAELAVVAARFNDMLERLPVLQQQLVASEERHRLLLEKLSRNVPGMIYQFVLRGDGHGSLPFVSEQIRTMFELEPEAVMEDATRLQDRIHPDDRPGVEQAIAASFHALTPFEAHYRVVLPRGGLRHYMTQSRPETAGEGEVRWWGCTVDVTQLRAAERGLQDLNDSLERRIAARTAELASANEALEAFAYSVAHDLRAPLHAVEGFSEAIPGLLERGDLPRAKHLSERVVANARRMNVLIDGFLALATTGRAPLQERAVSLQRLVDEVLAELPRPAAARIAVQPLPVLRADPATLRQVWWNLLSNAFKYSARREHPRVEVSWTQRDGEAVFSVRDNGAGFDPDQADRLFLPFRRLHDASEFEGTGIGLAQVRRIVEAHGGRIWAEGAPDAGASFHFALPAQRLAAEA